MEARLNYQILNLEKKYLERRLFRLVVMKEMKTQKIKA